MVPSPHTTHARLQKLMDFRSWARTTSAPRDSEIQEEASHLPGTQPELSDFSLAEGGLRALTADGRVTAAYFQHERMMHAYIT